MEQRGMEQRSAIESSNNAGSHAFALFAVALVIAAPFLAIIVTPMLPTTSSINISGFNDDYYDSIEFTIFENDQEREVFVIPPRYGTGTSFDVKLGFGVNSKDVKVTVINNATGGKLTENIVVERGQYYSVSLQSLIP